MLGQTEIIVSCAIIKLYIDIMTRIPVYILACEQNIDKYKYLNRQLFFLTESGTRYYIFQCRSRRLNIFFSIVVLFFFIQKLALGRYSIIYYSTVGQTSEKLTCGPDQEFSNIYVGSIHLVNTDNF